MSTESTQIVLRQFVGGQIPAGTVLAKVLSELSPSDIERLRGKAAEGVLTIELESMAAAGRFHASSADIREFIEIVKAIEASPRGPFDRTEIGGKFKTASGETTIKVRKGCFIATAVYGSYDHPNVLILRRFRDTFIESFFLGRCFCSTYYFAAPRLLSLPCMAAIIRVPAKLVLDSLCTFLKPQDKSTG
jgi:hypothetical protein